MGAKVKQQEERIKQQIRAASKKQRIHLKELKELIRESIEEAQRILVQVFGYSLQDTWQMNYFEFLRDLKRAREIQEKKMKADGKRKHKN